MHFFAFLKESTRTKLVNLSKFRKTSFRQQNRQQNSRSWSISVSEILTSCKQLCHATVRLVFCISQHNTLLLQPPLFQKPLDFWGLVVDKNPSSWHIVTSEALCLYLFPLFCESNIAQPMSTCVMYIYYK